MTSRVNEKGAESMNYFVDYQPFQHKNELNETISKVLRRNQQDQGGLVLLSRYAVKYPDVADLKLFTIIQAVKKWIPTVQRSIRKLEQLQILRRQLFNNTFTPTKMMHYERFKNHVKSFISASRLNGIYRGQPLRLLMFSIHRVKEELFEAL